LLPGSSRFLFGMVQRNRQVAGIMRRRRRQSSRKKIDKSSKNTKAFSPSD
jgi:hypothetical protein